MADVVTHIYSLNHPVTDEIRYIGKTIRPLNQRLRLHISNSRKGTQSHSSKWIQSLIHQDQRPVIKLIEEVPPGADWQTRERYWIAFHRDHGTRLTNHTDGGEGTPGYRHSPESIRKAADKHRGYQPTEETRRLLSQAARERTPAVGWHHTEEAKAKISVARKNRPSSPNLALRSAVKMPKPKLGTKSDAWYEAITQSNTGSKNGMSKLSPEVAQQIKIQATSGNLTYQTIASIYGVSRSLVGMIARGERWSYLL